MRDGSVLRRGRLRGRPIPLDLASIQAETADFGVSADPRDVHELFDPSAICFDCHSLGAVDVHGTKRLRAAFDSELDCDSQHHAHQ